MKIFHDIIVHACAAVPGPAPPSFVGEHYYCDSGSTGGWVDVYHTNDPLCAGCVHPNKNCCANIGLPWFIRELKSFLLILLNMMTLKLGLCTNEPYNNEAVLVDKLKLYIQ